MQPKKFPQEDPEIIIQRKPEWSDPVDSRKVACAVG
jgi:hypothetical protein